MQIDILDLNTWGSDMWERLRWLRENDPVYWDEKNQLFVLSRYAEVFYVSKHNELFCSGEGSRPNLMIKLSILDMDEPRHGQLRKLVNRGFSPRMVGKLEEYFRRLTTRKIDSVADKGACDIVSAVAAPLPLEIIAEMIGIEPEYREKFHRWSDDMIAGDGNYDKPDVMAKASAAFAEYVEYLEHIITARRENPRDDLVSILVHARDEGILGSSGNGNAENAKLMGEEAAAMAEDELTLFLVTLLVAGNETTRNAITGGLSALIENPAERQKLVDNPELIPCAAEEIVRYVSPVLNFVRTATLYFNSNCNPRRV